MILKNRYVQSILLSHVLLQLGIWIRNFAILLYVTDLTNNDPYYVSLISVVEFAPIFVFSIIGGTFADRWRPKRTMVWCDLLSALSVFVVLVTLVYGSWYAVFFATFISAILSQFSQPSAMKLFKQHVAEDKLQGVMAMFQSMMAIFMVIGPMLGTFVYQRFGIEISIGVMGAMFLASALVLAFLPPDTVTEDNQTDRNFSRELRDGIRYVWNNPTLKTLAGMFAHDRFGCRSHSAADDLRYYREFGQEQRLPSVVADGERGADAGRRGLVMAVAKKVSPEKLLAAGLISSVITTMVIGWSTSAPVTIAAQAIAGLFFPCIHIGINTLMLKNTEQSFIGRVNGVMNPMFMGFMVIGMSLSGVFKSNMSLFAVSCIAGLLFAAGAIMLGPLFKQGASHKSPAEKADPSTV